MVTKEKKKKLRGKWNLYEKKGSALERKNKSCPKCGEGTFMAKHGNRNYCGNCHYTVFNSKS